MGSTALVSGLSAFLATLLFILMTGCTSTPAARSFAILEQRVDPGNTVYVLDESLEETQGKIVEVSVSDLVLDVDGTSKRIDEEQVRLIDRYGDSLWNGFLIGLGVGTLGAAMGDPSYTPCRNDPQEQCADYQVGKRVLVVGAMGLVGTGIDALLVRRNRVYEAPNRPVGSGSRLSVVPLAGRAGTGISVRFRFR